MDIGFAYRLFSFISNKHQQGYISPTEFTDSFNFSQTQYQQELIEMMIGWDSNRKKIKLPAANTQQVKQKLSPFIVVLDGQVVPGSGQLVKGVGLENIGAMRTSDNKKRIWRVEEDRIPAHLSSVIDPIEDNPIYVERAGYYQIYPINIGSVNYEYIKSPNPVIYGFTLVNNRPIYDPSTSTQPQWGDGELSNLLIRVLFQFGISVQAQNLTQYYNEVKSNGE